MPLPGDIGVVASRSWVGRAIMWITRAPVSHAFVCIGGGGLIEGDPHGARIRPVTAYADAQWLTALSTHLTDAQRKTIVDWCMKHVGTPYSWIDDAEIGFTDLFGWAPKWMRRRLRSDSTLMCSQLCDAAYKAAGVDLFPGKPDGAISPGDLWRLNAACA